MVGTISTNGTTTSFNTTSDRRLKNLEVPQLNYRDAIKSLWIGNFDRYQSFSHIGKPASGFGVVAQQAYSALPEAIRDETITRPKDPNGTWLASQEPFAYLALWGTKDLYNLSEKQQEQADTIKNDLASLKREVSLLREANATQAETVRLLKTEVSLLRQRGLQSARN